MEYLDSLADQLMKGRVGECAHLMFTYLQSVRMRYCRDEWNTWIESLIRSHALGRIAHSEPFTSRAYNKPRGYAGDAVMLDYIYAHHIPELNNTSLQETTPIGLLHRYITRMRPSAQAVFSRCTWFAHRMDEIGCPGTLAHSSERRVLSIAAGHLRERHFSNAVTSGAIDELVAIDQDQASLDEIERSKRDLPITTKHMSVLEFLRHPTSLGSFNYIYAGGLYDYLPDRVGTALIDAMYKALKPGGSASIANFIPDHPDVGYMESFMQWHLLYRTELDLMRIFGDAKCSEYMSARTWTDTVGCIAYLELVKTETAS